MGWLGKSYRKGLFLLTLILLTFVVVTKGVPVAAQHRTIHPVLNQVVEKNTQSELIKTRELRNSQPIELLVLSACQTASGDKRAALGLAGLAVRSGARSTAVAKAIRTHVPKLIVNSSF